MEQSRAFYWLMTKLVAEHFQISECYCLPVHDTAQYAASVGLLMS